MKQKRASKPKGPGPREISFEEELTETEYGIVCALRDGLLCERNWSDAYERDAWYYIREMTDAIRSGRDVEEFKNICSPDQFAHCYPAALACAASVKAFVKSYRRTHKKG